MNIVTKLLKRAKHAPLWRALAGNQKNCPPTILNINTRRNNYGWKYQKEIEKEDKVWGDFKSNSIIAKIINQLPLIWNHESIKLGQTKAPSNTHIPILIYPNPLNQRKYIVLNSGFTFSRFGHMSNATQTPKLPDWALADMFKPYNAGNSECIKAAGFFDEQWQPKLTH